MARNYRQINKEIRDTGFFSEYLPPCFSLNPVIFRQIPGENCDLIPPYSFTMSRFNGKQARRTIYIPEIGTYAAAYSFMKNNDIFEDIINFTDSYSKSFSPVLGADDSIMRHEQSYGGETAKLGSESGSTYIKNIAEKIIRGTGAKQVLKLDISNCFSSFYSHMIPAILLGVDKEEEEFNKSQQSGANAASVQLNPLYETYAKLDKINRRQNQNRTNGLLVGPLSSKIIAEGLLTRMDIELSNAGINFSRYVDDYEVYIYNIGDEKSIISIFTKVLKRYGFTLNDEKTELLDFPYYVTMNLEKIINEYKSEKQEIDQNDLMELFNNFFQLESDGTKGAIRFLLKSIEKKPVVPENHELYRSYLLTILNNDSRSLAKACALLIEDIKTKPLEENNIQLIIALLHTYIRDDFDLETLWLLYLLLQAEIEISTTIIDEVVDSNMELAQLMLFRKAKLSDEQLVRVITKAKSWILVYELYCEDKLTETETISRLCLNKYIRYVSVYEEQKSSFLL